jgi:hypothetical protein
MVVKTLLKQNLGVFVSSICYTRPFRLVLILYHSQRSCHQAFANHMPSGFLAENAFLELMEMGGLSMIGVLQLGLVDEDCFCTNQRSGELP